ncbi:nuclear receptor subfamily 0 group B member 2 [Platysternon megacephalum]|uniref:Nuclear receptor subfamily 0 group B member 2 n=1 Tax=Platysternon megacephalum TaxID=55544 RepID=A0A4D9F558_9SAUR|nr:nuclear receptor subfamily 0 group B member 2 [Platysternon megacephalum]
MTSLPWSAFQWEQGLGFLWGDTHLPPTGLNRGPPQPSLGVVPPTLKSIWHCLLPSPGQQFMALTIWLWLRKRNKSKNYKLGGRGKNIEYPPPPQSPSRLPKPQGALGPPLPGRRAKGFVKVL